MIAGGSSPLARTGVFSESGDGFSVTMPLASISAEPPGLGAPKRNSISLGGGGIVIVYSFAPCQRALRCTVDGHSDGTSPAVKGWIGGGSCPLINYSSLTCQLVEG